MFNWKNQTVGPQYFDEAEISGVEILINKALQLEGGNVVGEKGLLIDGTLTNCHISTSDHSAVIVSAMSKLVDCVIEARNVLINGDFSGTLIMKGEDNVDVGGRLEFGSGCRVQGIAYVDHNIIQNKGIKVIMNMETKPFERYTPSALKSIQQIETTKQD